MLLRTITGASLLLAAVFFAVADLSLWLLPVLFCGIYVALFLLAFLFLCLLCALVDMEKPQEKDSTFYRRVMHLYIEALIPLVGLKIDVAGLEKTPKEGRFLLVCNHQNESDPGILLHYFKNSQLAFISKRENRTMFAVGKFMHKTLCQLVNRENDREALKTILNCIRLIKEDEVSVGVFPEGYCSLDHKLHTFRHGVFKIAQKTNVPIVVCTLQNTHTVLPNFLHLKPTHVHLHLVGVLQPEDIQVMTTVEVGTRVHAMMAQDLGPELVLQEQA